MAWMKKSTPKEIMAMGTIRSRVREDFSPTKLEPPSSQTKSINRPTSASPADRGERRAKPTTTRTNRTVAATKGNAVRPCSLASRFTSMARL